MAPVRGAGTTVARGAVGGGNGRGGEAGVEDGAGAGRGGGSAGMIGGVAWRSAPVVGRGGGPV
ncbi:MAG: hypothetical protein ACRDR6_26360, partial [Pseudonocardiaceae bacterium]